MTATEASQPFKKLEWYWLEGNNLTETGFIVFLLTPLLDPPSKVSLKKLVKSCAYWHQKLVQEVESRPSLYFLNTLFLQLNGQPHMFSVPDEALISGLGPNLGILLKLARKRPDLCCLT